MTSAAMPSSLLALDRQDFDLFPVRSESMQSDLTVAQAAKILGSREGLIHSLIEDGDVDSRIVDGEKMVVRESFIAYKKERDRRIAAMAEMVRENQEMGLYDMEFNLEEYNATRNAVRNANRCS